MPAPTSYSRLQVRLHWITLALILFQFVFSDAIAAAWRAVRGGTEPELGPLVALHVLSGLLILGIALWRIGLRLTHGVPPTQGPKLLAGLAHLGHLAIYAVLLAMAVSGAAAWFGAVAPAANAHAVLKVVLILLVLGHVAAALWHHFVRRDGTLARMR